ncbi:septation ring formation regulator EzrA [Aquibacillus halophilus]|uniref:Septation ring formation regulator EzrA n=1 Tax=Aquibacillus halophilus TaxID=930132 RepID=A0A6A8DGJ3_9BACI|nr:septation ring formation regulator EzrA [Aquibacillus halophilus]MRH42841.1 septation ring formation regulator EzrA [Aquibacillus halophilus]
MAYVIGSVLVVIALIILGLILRKRVYDEVDRLEGWKMDIMNRNVTSELARVKKLNLSGETQEKFESWKDRWDVILTRELPDIEEYLLDAEEASDRFRISGAKKNLHTVNQTLLSIEENIEKMFQELDELIESEQSSREEVDNLQPKISGLRKKLIQNRHQYGKAEIRFEVELDELEQEVTNFFALTDSGNYLEAEQLVEDMKKNLVFLEEQVEEFPTVYKKCKQELPAQIDDLLFGIKDMKEEGYRIEHLGFEKEIHKFQESLVKSVVQLEKGSIGDAYEIILPIEERIAEMYQLLEKEAVSKSFVDKQLPSFHKLLTEVDKDLTDTNEEVIQLQEAYYFEDSDMKTHMSLQKHINQLKKEHEEIEVHVVEEKLSHDKLRDLLENSYKQLVELEESHNKFKERIHTLRKDEIEAKEEVLKIRRDLFETNRKLQKSNIPGVPSYIWNLMEEATLKSDLVIKNLEKHPLDMGEVQHLLSEAKKSIQSMVDQTELLLDHARLVEVVIQYANRYRSQYAILAARLYEAEELFRKFEYESALEEAARALEEVEPGALKRLEELSKVPS